MCVCVTVITPGMVLSIGTKCNVVTAGHHVVNIARHTRWHTVKLNKIIAGLFKSSKYFFYSVDVPTVNGRLIFMFFSIWLVTFNKGIQTLVFTDENISVNVMCIGGCYAHTTLAFSCLKWMLTDKLKCRRSPLQFGRKEETPVALRTSLFLLLHYHCQNAEKFIIIVVHE